MAGAAGAGAAGGAAGRWGHLDHGGLGTFPAETDGLFLVFQVDLGQLVFDHQPNQFFQLSNIQHGRFSRPERAPGT